MKYLLYSLPLGIFLILVGYFAVGLNLNPKKMPSALINQKIPFFNLDPIKDRVKGLSSDDLRGHVSLLNIFGSWCLACVSEHAFLMELKSKNLVPIYGIDWRENKPDDGPNWLKKRGDPYRLIGDDPDSRVSIALGVTGAPETFFIDKNGVIRYKHVGPIDSKIWQQRLWPLVKELQNQ